MTWTFAWLRSWPSGHVHAVTRLDNEEPYTHCGIRWPGKRWVSYYPPLCKRCQTCEREVERRAMRQSAPAASDAP